MFELRDAHLKGVERYDEVLLWFEHDLYDQLQILQVLDWMATNKPEHVTLSILCIDHFDGVEPFHGLGQLTPDQFESLVGSEMPVTMEMLRLARDGWAAFRSPDPQAVVAFLGRDLTVLPFLRAALLRYLEEFPNVSRGLGRTEHQILSCVGQDSTSPAPLFGLSSAMEENRFMGDWSFWHLLDGLTKGNMPLIETASGEAFRFPDGPVKRDDAFDRQRLSLTEAGHAVLDGRRDRLADHGYDHWFGGVHMISREAIWRWDKANGVLIGENGHD